MGMAKLVYMHISNITNSLSFKSVYIRKQSGIKVVNIFHNHSLGQV
jgi:hypothetical protein